jgi:hypothetical protein
MNSRDPDRQRQHGGGGGEFQRRRQAFGDQVHHRPREAVADSELAMQRIPHECRVLHEERLIQTQLMHQGHTLRLGIVLAKHDRNGVADELEHGEGDESHDQQHGDGLQYAGQDEGEHREGLQDGPGGRHGLMS